MIGQYTPTGRNSSGLLVYVIPPGPRTMFAMYPLSKALHRIAMSYTFSPPWYVGRRILSKLCFGNRETASRLKGVL